MPTTNTRQPRDGKKERVHMLVPQQWLRRIDRAAERQNLSRSNYIARVAHEAAKVDLLDKAHA